MNFYTTSIIALVFFYILLLIVVFFFQRNLLYHPSVDNHLKDQTEIEPAEIKKVKITTKDKIDLIGWFYNKDIEKFKTILFLHGNAGSLGNRTYKLNHFKDLNVNFLIIAWRGFSGNKGKPNEMGLYEDAESAIRWLNANGIKEKNIILYGESLGTGVAIEVAQNKNYAGIILESPFTSMVNMGKKYYPFFPVSFLLKDKFESYRKIQKISVPFYVQEYGDHMIDYDTELIMTLEKFIQSLN